MQIKASLQAHKNGFYVIFKPGMRVSLIQGEFGFEPRRPYMTAAQKQEFAAASAGTTYDALIDALEPIREGLEFYEFYSEDIITLLEMVMFYRNSIRGKALESLSPGQEARVWRMMGEPLEPPSAPDFNFCEAIKDMGKPNA